MTTKFRGSGASHRKTLLDVCHEIATDAEWSTYTAAAQLGPEALRKQFPEDFSECAAEILAVSYHDRPYDDPVAAQLYIKARTVEQELLERAVMKMVDEHWIAQARRAGQASPGPIDPTLLLALQIDINATAIELEGVEYLDLAFRPASAEQFEELVQVVRDQSPRMDPSFHKIVDFRGAVSEILGRKIPDATFRKAMLAAGVRPRWSAKGRKLGSPSHGKCD